MHAPQLRRHAVAPTTARSVSTPPCTRRTPYLSAYNYAQCSGMGVPLLQQQPLRLRASSLL